MIAVPLVQTGGYDTDAWIRRVFPAAVLAARTAIPMTETFEDDEAGRLERVSAWNLIACCAVANWGVVSGWGGLEYNFNPGLVICGRYNGECTQFSALYGGEWMRSFSALSAGVVAWFAWVQAASRDAWSRLELGALDYWDVFQRATHRGGASAADALRAFDRVAALMGVATIDDVERELIAHEWRPPTADAARVPALEVVPGVPPRVIPRPGTGPRPPGPVVASSGGGLGLVETLGIVTGAVGLAKAVGWF